MAPDKDGARVINVACLTPNSPRRETWREFFACTQVPVTRDEPLPTVLPSGGEPLPCYFVDFSVMGDVGKALLIAANQRRNNDPRIYAMLQEDIYPIKSAADIVIVRAPWRLWSR